jgi:hypothetical protein
VTRLRQVVVVVVAELGVGRLAPRALHGLRRHPAAAPRPLLMMRAADVRRAAAEQAAGEASDGLELLHDSVSVSLLVCACVCSPAEELGARQESSTHSASPQGHTQHDQSGKYLCWVFIKLRNCPRVPKPIVLVTEMPLPLLSRTCTCTTRAEGSAARLVLGSFCYQRATQTCDGASILICLFVLSLYSTSIDPT